MKGVASIPGRRWRRPYRPAKVQGSVGCCRPIRGPVVLRWWGEALHNMSNSGSVGMRSTALAAVLNLHFLQLEPLFVLGCFFL
jgi:hypothetical protein